MGIKNLLIQFVNEIRKNIGSDKLLFFNMANPMDRSLAKEMYPRLNVNCILIQNYDNDNYLGMIDSAISWAQTLKSSKI